MRLVTEEEGPRRAVSAVYGYFRAVVEAAGIDPGLGEVVVGTLRDAESRDMAHGAGATVLLSLLACEAAGAPWENAVPAAACWRGLDTAAKVLDDALDGDVARATDARGVAAVVNVAPAYYALSMMCLARLEAPVYVDLAERMQRAILRMAAGQHIGLLLRDGGSVQTGLRSVVQKTGSSLGLAAVLGARCATADPATVAALEEFGSNAGVVLQLLDDLIDFRARGPGGDVAEGRRTLPVLYALTVSPDEERPALAALLASARDDSGAEGRAREWMVGLGAEAYLWAEVLRYRRRAHETGRGYTERGLAQWLSDLEGATLNR